MRLAALIAAAALGLAVAGCGDELGEGRDERRDRDAHDDDRGAARPRPARAARARADVVARVLPGVVNVKTVGFDGDKGEALGRRDRPRAA